MKGFFCADVAFKMSPWSQLPRVGASVCVAICTGFDSWLPDPAGRRRMSEALPRWAGAFNTDRTPSPSASSPAAPKRQRLHERTAGSIKGRSDRF
jgi:hypothetical protein